MPQAGQLALNPSVSPPRILAGQAYDQVTYFLWDRRAAGAARVGPVPLDQSAMPGQQGARRHDPMHPKPAWKMSGEHSQDRPVGPVQPRMSDLAAQHRHLMPQHEDLQLLRDVAANHQDQPTHDSNEDQIQQPETHEQRP
jgi:hypothetical protein